MAKSIQIEQTEIPAIVRAYVLDRDGWYCQNENCINPFGKYCNLTIHHIISRGRFGAGWDPCNLITLCWPCHEQIERLKKFIDGCDVYEVEKLIHRTQIPFYDHEFTEGEVECSHSKIIKGKE